MQNEIELTVIMPCLNEEETIGSCIYKAQKCMSDNHINGEILIADNGSTDNSVDIAKRFGARVVHISEKGYGSALIGGTSYARGKYCIMGDSDDSYDFSDLMPYLSKLREGYDLVMGNRFKGGIEKGAMPFSHKYIGTPIISFLGRLFYKNRIGDFNCGMRGYNTDSIINLNLTSTGMEYASEMIVKASLYGLKIAEVPTTLSKDGRTRRPYLRTWSDGWRHLKFLLVHSPNWLFLYPGLFLFFIGLILMIPSLINPCVIFGIKFDINTILFGCAFIIMGINAVLFSCQAKMYAYKTDYIPPDKLTKKLSKITDDMGVFIGAGLLFIGFILMIISFIIWANTSFGNLNANEIMRISIPSVCLMIAGLQIIFSSFMIGIINLKRK